MSIGLRYIFGGSRTSTASFEAAVAQGIGRWLSRTQHPAASFFFARSVGAAPTTDTHARAWPRAYFTRPRAHRASIRDAFLTSVRPRRIDDNMIGGFEEVVAFRPGRDVIVRFATTHLVSRARRRVFRRRNFRAKTRERIQRVAPSFCFFFVTFFFFFLFFFCETRDTLPSASARSRTSAIRDETTPFAEA